MTGLREKKSEGLDQDKRQGVIYRRVVDDKGRVTLPLEMRQQLEIRAGEEVEFLVREDGQWYIRKSFLQKVCSFCGCLVDLINVWGQTLCRRCAEKYVYTLARELDLKIVVGKGGNWKD